jgi:hypothetical protein
MVPPVDVLEQAVFEAAEVTLAIATTPAGLWDVDGWSWLLTGVV